MLCGSCDGESLGESMNEALAGAGAQAGRIHLEPRGLRHLAPPTWLPGPSGVVLAAPGAC